ncbi:glycosyltransferase [Wenyingzhuangia sp. 2_MG-2023]|uniref:glycosyltransferase n=1 Tax=Wenyingzhuangia sp. 2_MG-2023 TaxID=3062639 RepID=UPI0026E16FB9|nr:glycosyltransferase [Wenyingzhuangia sp. 2_MG-2023]MDO6739314.1 glycosyltransferase [Wenyingzhuangia sp. 2_MG-2023]
MKVIHVVGSIDVSAGGPSRSVPQTCKELANLDVEIEIITRETENPVKVPTTENFRVIYKSIVQLFWFGFSLSKQKVDVIHLQHVWDPYVHVLAGIARLKGIPYVVTPRGMLEPWIMKQRPLKKRIGRFLYLNKDLKKANAIHVTCELEKRNIIALGFETPTINIPNGVLLNAIPEPKVNYGTKKVVFLSRIHEKKGIELLLDAWKQIKNTAWSLEIAGEGDENYIKSIHEIIKKEEIENVSLVGAQYGEEKWTFLKGGDVFVLPTYSENFGIVVAEALAVGVPVITTTGTPWEELKTHQCGWWIELSVENLKQTLLEAMQTPEETLQKMGQQGINLVKKNYDIAVVASNVKKMYTQIIKNKG